MKLLYLILKKNWKILDSSKTPQESDIATKMIRDKIDIFVPIMYSEWNQQM